ncbi:hypothetical protein QQP08_005004 [Theobroma cacao]|nr:hypothetical protein QQP08_005004 [Theobroma cacao]
MHIVAIQVWRLQRGYPSSMCFWVFEEALWVPPPTSSIGYAVGVQAQGPVGHVGQVQHGGAVQGSRRRKIYSAVGKMATRVPFSSMLGVPTPWA